MNPELPVHRDTSTRFFCFLLSMEGLRLDESQRILTVEMNCLKLDYNCGGGGGDKIFFSCVFGSIK
jgi:hypothetical protein